MSLMILLKNRKCRLSYLDHDTYGVHDFNDSDNYIVDNNKNDDMDDG